MMNPEMENFCSMIKNSNNIVFLGGAGVSTESNIPDFRSNTGLYNMHIGNFSAEEILSSPFFFEHTKEFYEFYNDKMIYKDAKPNNAHLALAKLEELGKLKAIITQNIDGLHQLAGSRNVLELHGSVLHNHCTGCGKYYSLDDIYPISDIPFCKECGSIIKPDVTLYQETLNMSVFEKAIYYIEHADILIVGGTSLVVYPAASLVRYYKNNKLVLINRDETAYDSMANLIFRESIGDILNDAVSQL